MMIFEQYRGHAATFEMHIDDDYTVRWTVRLNGHVREFTCDEWIECSDAWVRTAVPCHPIALSA